MRACQLVVVALLFGTGACAAPKREPFSFFDARIAPLIKVGCQRQTTGCHTDDGRGFALGNLDLSSYAGILHRKDVLEPYGPYSVPLLLLKGGDPIQVQVRTVDPPDPSAPDKLFVNVTTDIRHGGGEGAIAEGSIDYSTLKQWLDEGYAENGVPRAPVLAQSVGPCTPGDDSIDSAPDPIDGEGFSTFTATIQPVLEQRCAGSSCHGARQADMFLTCGREAREQRWNYWVVTRYLNSQAVSSELLRRPLGLANGGVFHEGGQIFKDTKDADYQTLLRWIGELVKRSPETIAFTPGPDEAGLRFFANRVQPLLVRKGCMFLACHSPSMFHDLRLRGGARGDFSEIATRRNYEMSKLLLALESDTPNTSRLVAKNLCPPESGGRGIKHRGGLLLEDFGGCADDTTRASPDKCEGVDADAGDLNQIPAYCVFARWHTIERQQAIANGEIDPMPPQGVVFVKRPPGVGGPTEFDSFHPGADLSYGDLSFDAQGHAQLGATRSLLASCGLPSSVDVRGPAVAYDAKHIAFAVRSAADKPFRIYEVEPSGTGCAEIAGLAADSDLQNGILLHDFDPAYAPNGGIVFASTRGYLNGGGGYSGPTRTPARLEPNANLYVFDQSATTPVRQLTYLLDQELQPNFMTDGRLIFTTEKRALDFHQLAGRRQNLDGGDYHPLFAQRPSIGFASATEIVELTNRNLAIVAAPLDASDGGGTIAIVNRSIGPDQDDRDPGDKSYIHSLTTPFAGAFGGSNGIFRSPAPLPTGNLIASCDLQASDLTQSPHYSLCELDPTGKETPREIYRDPNLVAIEAVAVYARVPHEFVSRSDEVNGTTQIQPGASDAIVHFLDVPLLGTLLFSNTRTGRPIDKRVAGIEVLEPEPPPSGATSFAAIGSGVVNDSFGQYYESLRSHGHVAMRADGSLRVDLPGGTPLTLALTDKNGKRLSFDAAAPFMGEMRQREATQFYPGERVHQGMGRLLFDGICAGCHGSISGRELDVHVTVDILTSASRTLASDELHDLR